MMDIVSGFFGVCIDMKIKQILHHLNIMVHCRRELASLKDPVMKIKPIISQIQQYRLAINMKRKEKASVINGWLKDLDGLLQQALEMVQRCIIPMCSLFPAIKPTHGSLV